MKQLLLITAGVILFLALPLIVWRLTSDPLERHVAPVVGTWLSSFDKCTTLYIYIDEAGGCIALKRCAARRSSTYPLRFENCLHYLETDGKRIDLFYAPASDVLLLMPGGVFQRIPKTDKNE